MVPFSAAKTKGAPEFGPPPTRNSFDLPLKTVPVGAAVKSAGLPFGPGMVTTSDCGVPSPL